jgi:hypothetical protein
MGDDTASRCGWGVVLEGHVFDLEHWQDAFKQPFDPWKQRAGGSFAQADWTARPRRVRLTSAPRRSWMRSTARWRASRRTGFVRLKHVVEILSDGTLRRQMFEQTGEVLRLKGRAVGGVGPDGAPEPPKPSEPQQWLSIAAEDSARSGDETALLADALTHFARCDDWFEVYKALECLIQRFAGREKDGQMERFRCLGWANADEITRLRETANSKRHARGSFDPPARPMEPTEARDLLATLMAGAFREAPTRPTPSPERSKGGRKARRKACRRGASR